MSHSCQATVGSLRLVFKSFQTLKQGKSISEWIVTSIGLSMKD